MTQAQAAQIEYTIYTYETPPTQQKRDISWRKHATELDISKAMDEAKRLYRTQKFQKIEVKKKFFDEKKNRPVDLTLKVFEAGSRKIHWPVVLTALTGLTGTGILLWAALS